MDQIVIRAKMLGKVEFLYKGKPFTIERNNTTKVNQLLQMLMYYPDGLTRDQLMFNLFHDEEIADPSNSMRALVFRLRKALPKAGLPKEDYVFVKRGTYKISPNVKVECDAFDFADAATAAFSESNPDAQIKYLEKACDIYGGDFLPGLSAVEWVVTVQVKLKKYYDRCVKQLCELYLLKKDYSSLYKVSHKANHFYPYDGWQYYEMEALIELNKPKEALKLYQDTEALMIGELGLDVSPKMKEAMERLADQMQYGTDEIFEVKKNLDSAKDDLEGGFYCSYPVFVESYRYIKRVIKRSRQSAWLMLCTINRNTNDTEKNREKMNIFAEDLAEAIRTSTRGGDMYARYSNNQFVILLLDIAKEDCVLVQARINENLPKASIKRFLEYNIIPVNLDSAGTANDTDELEDIVRGE